jgi:hypothetical protein
MLAQGHSIFQGSDDRIHPQSCEAAFAGALEAKRGGQAAKALCFLPLRSARVHSFFLSKNLTGLQRPVRFSGAPIYLIFRYHFFMTCPQSVPEKLLMSCSCHFISSFGRIKYHAQWYIPLIHGLSSVARKIASCISACSC